MTKGGPLMNAIWQDFRYALRMPARRPGFTVVGVLTLALGIGANTTIFTLVNAVLLRPLPVHEPQQLVSILGTDARNNTPQQQFMPMSYLNYQDLRDNNDTLTGMAAFTGTGVNLSGADKAEQINAGLVSGNYFDVLGVRAALGTTFDLELAKKPGGYPVAVLGYGLWQRRFGGDPSIVGKTIKLNQQPFTVVGVAPKSFLGTFAIGNEELWIPDAMHDQVLTGLLREWFLQRGKRMIFAFGRLKEGVGLPQAQTQLQMVASHLTREYPNDNEGRSVRLVPLSESTVGPFRGLLLQASRVLMGVVGLVLLIACANLANLLLARGADRRRELAVRMALGANRSRLSAQLLSESLFLSLLGGAAGLAVAFASRYALLAFRPPFLNAVEVNLPMDATVLLFTVGVAVGTAFLFGTLPAWQAMRFNLSDTMKEGGRSGAAGRRHALRSGLIVAEVALSVVALVGAGLFLSSLHNAQRIDPGFEAKDMLVMNMDLGAQNYTEDQAREFHRRLIDRLRALPQVRGASLASLPPLTRGIQRTIFPEGADPSDLRHGILSPIKQVDTGYFQSLGIPLVRGRSFAETDREGQPLVAVVNQTFAEKFFPGQDAMGKHFRCFGETWNLEIVGITRDAKVYTLGEDPTPEFYLPLLQHPSPQVSLHVRTTGEPMAALPAVRSTVQELDRELPLVQVQTISQLLAQALWAARFGSTLLLVFGLLALTLAAVGIYGVMSYTVEQRRQEMGIRIALGAQRQDVYRLVLGQGLLPAILGAAIGLAIAAFLTRGIAALLYGLRGIDPVTYSAVPVVLLSVALLACFLPARRATRVDPLVALRYE